MRRSRAGVAIPTTLFIALLVYFLSTVLISAAQRNLRLTQGEAERMRRHSAARGHIHEFVVNMIQNSSYEAAHGAGNPIVASEGGVFYRTWAEPDPRFSTVVHVVCEVVGNGRQVSASRAVYKSPNSSGIIYVDTAPAGLPPQLQVYTDDSGVWSALPPPPRNYFVNPLGAPPPALVSTPDPVEGLSGYGIGVDGNLHAIFFPTVPAPLPPDVPLPTLMTYNRAAGTWSQSSLPADYVLPPMGALMAGEGGVSYLTDNTGIFMRPSESAPWARIAGAPAGPTITSMSGNQDSLFVIANATLQRFDRTGGSWSTVVWPNADYFTPEGELIEAPGTPVVLNQITVSSGGVLQGLWQRPGIDTIFRYVPPKDQDPPSWSPYLPVYADDVGRPVIADLVSIGQGSGKLMRYAGGTQIFNDTSPLPPPPPLLIPPVTSGAFPLPDPIYIPASAY